MKILISGASGLVGTHLIPTLKAKGHAVFKLVRKTPKLSDEIQWDAEKGFADSEQAKLEGFDAVIHLAGENIGEGTWTEEKKKSLMDSRIIGTRVLVEGLKKTENPPKIFISASAEGFYGDGKDAILTEKSPKGEGFLADLCDAWEIESQKAEEFGARVVNPRIGIVLSKEGGALSKMLTPFKFGVGGAFGSGKQWMSWIMLEDLINIIHFALENENVRGAINSTAPNPVTNEEFTKTLGKVLNRPTFFTIPEFAIKLIFGEMGENLLLRGTRVIPERLQELGFKFEFTNFEDAIKSAVI